MHAGGVWAQYCGYEHRYDDDEQHTDDVQSVDV
jgi:hypothetical protein